MSSAAKKKTSPPSPPRCEPDLARALKCVSQLMAIPGPSGQEKKVADFVVKTLLAAGAKRQCIAADEAHRKTPLAGNTGNLVLKLPGTRRGPRRLLMAHLDTVPICVGAKPVRDGQVIRSGNPQTGLGADDRAGTAAILTAAVEILERKLPHGPLTFLWCIQEEIGLYGARNVSPAFLGRPKLAFNWDGGAPEKLTIGATGGYRMTIHLEGVASHAGVAPEMGASAIAMAGLAIARLHREGWHGLIQKDGQHGTSNIGAIAGGEATNVVTDRVTLRAEARSHSPAFRGKIVEAIQRAFTDAAAEVKTSLGHSGRVTFDGRLDYEAFRLASDEPCVCEAEAAVQDVGRSPLRAISNGGLDANWMFQHGIPTVTLGCGQQNVHMTSERLDIPQFEDACRIALRIATG